MSRDTSPRNVAARSRQTELQDNAARSKNLSTDRKKREVLYPESRERALRSQLVGHSPISWPLCDIAPRLEGDSVRPRPPDKLCHLHRHADCAGLDGRIDFSIHPSIWILTIRENEGG